MMKILAIPFDGKTFSRAFAKLKYEEIKPF
jgi:hypothetical protein